MSLTPDQLAYQMAHIHQDRGPYLIATTAVLSVLSTAAIYLRFLVRWRTKVGFKTDDYAILMAGIMAWASFIAYYFQTHNGLGKHVITLSDHQFTEFFKGLLFLGPAFVIGVMLTQISFLFLYRRVFTTAKPWFHQTLYVLGFFVLATCISCFFASLFFCTPFTYSWDKTIPGGHCNEVQNVYITHDVMTLVLDSCLVAAPIPIIWGLQMHTRAKLAVMGMFLLGSFVCVINLIRLPTLIHVDQVDLTYNDVTSILWTHAELCLGIVGACLPCYRPLFKNLENIFGSNQKSTSASQPRSKIPTDAYKSLDGKETSMDGSKIKLVPSDQWSGKSAPTSQVPGTLKSQATVNGRSRERDVESGLSPHVINVTHAIDVSTTPR